MGAANFAPEVIRVLRQAGFRFVQQANGSHELWFAPRVRKTVAVPSTIKMLHTAQKILFEAGLKKHFF